MSELKPCPFCGRTKYLKVHRRKHRDFPDGMFAIKCTRCGIRGRYQLTEERAVDAWNERDYLPERMCYSGRTDCFECSECGFLDAYAVPDAFRFCPHCGAKVVKE